MLFWIPFGLIVIVFLILMYTFRGFFKLNDVTTTPAQPPEYRKIKTLIGERPMEFSRAAAILNAQHYPNLVPLILDMDPNDAYKKSSGSRA